jgi:DNA-binding beta-propeller fold protein YncE
MRHSSSARLLIRVGFSTFLILLAIVALVAQQSRSDNFIVKPLPLPGANGLVMLDYFAYDHGSRRLWVPAANTGSVDVIDTTTDQIQRIEGFPVTQVEFKGKQRAVGPSSVAIGEGMVFVGSRADSRICIIDARTLKLGKCIAFAAPSAGLGSAPDGLMYIAATHELWASSGAPPVGIPAADRSIKILAASSTDLTPSGRIPLPGSAEGYAVDNEHGRFYTNLEETGQTVAIDVRKRAVVSTWRSCEDPSGVAVDAKRGFVFVACGGDHVIVLDAEHKGQVVGSIATGAGVDNIDYVEDTGTLYVAAAEAAQLTVAQVDDHGKPTGVAVVPTTKGTRSVVAGAGGVAYLIDPYGGNILKVMPK